MINLLPDDKKKQIKAARSNVLLLRYNIMLIALIVFLGIAVAITYYILTSAQTSAETAITSNNDKEKSYAVLKSKAEVFRGQLSEAKQILDGQISYSDAILNISRLIPNGVILTGINLDQTSFSQPVTFTAKVKGEQEAYNLKKSFENSPLFSGAAFGVLTKSTSTDYPITIELKVTINREAAK